MFDPTRDGEGQWPGRVRRGELRERLAAVEAGLKELSAVEVGGCSAEELGDAAVAVHRLQAALDAQVARIDRAMATSGRWQADGARTATAWLVAHTATAKQTARRWLRRGRAVAELPAVAAAWETGEITTDAVHRLLAASNPRTRAELAEHAPWLVEWAKQLSYADFDRLMGEWSKRADPDGAATDATRQADGREAHLSESISGMWFGRMTFDPVSGQAVAGELARLEQAMFEADWAGAKQRLGRAPTLDELSRTPAQRRADAIVEMARRSAAVPPGAKMPRVLLSVLVGESTFRRLCEIEATRRPVAPEALTGWLDDAVFERILFGAPDRVLSVSRQRAFPDALRRAIEVRDRTCDGPCCDIPATRCHIDHVKAYKQGGLTSEANGQPLCDSHNAAKGTTPGRRQRRDPDRHLRWLDDPGRDPP